MWSWTKPHRRVCCPRSPASISSDHEQTERGERDGNAAPALRSASFTAANGCWSPCAGRAIANAAHPTDEAQLGQVPVTEGRYAQSATRTLEPILDIPRNVQVVPRQLIEERAIDDPQEAMQNVSAMMRGGSIFGEGEVFAIRASTAAMRWT